MNIRTFPTLFSLLFCLSATGQVSIWSAGLIRPDSQQIRFTFIWKTERGKTVWVIQNAEERIRVDNISRKGDSLFIQMPVFESSFKLKFDGKSVTGSWIKNGSTGIQEMPIHVVKSQQRFESRKAPLQNISGRWAVNFSSDSNNISVAEFEQHGQRLTGTILNPTGDYRYLQGVVNEDSILLSAFDGSHAFLFKGIITDGNNIRDGKFYSGTTYSESWIATKDSNAKVSEASVAMSVKAGETGLHFTFKDLGKKLVSISDKRFKNKVVVIQLMGSWCPNCMDETAFLSEYYDKNKQRGFEAIALAYEYSTDWNRSLKSLQKFRDRFNVKYTILNTEVSVSDSLRTRKTLPELTDIKFFPSSVIIDKKGKIRKIDTGFNGPATGSHYEQYKQEFEETINKLFKEN